MKLRRRMFKRDFLTGLYNRSVLERIEAAIDAGKCGALLSVDIDDFMWVNHSVGHIAGDACLRRIADLMREAAAGCLLGRVGGEEFLVYTEDGPGAERLAERIRSLVENDAELKSSRDAVPLRTSPDSSEHGCYGPVLTVSIGIARAARGLPFEQLFAQADEALSEAKNAGKNRIVTWPETRWSRSGAA